MFIFYNYSIRLLQKALRYASRLNDTLQAHHDVMGIRFYNTSHIYPFAAATSNTHLECANVDNEL